MLLENLDAQSIRSVHDHLAQSDTRSLKEVEAGCRHPLPVEFACRGKEDQLIDMALRHGKAERREQPVLHHARKMISIER
jgi:hypothetical protein